MRQEAWEKEWENINGHVELEEIFYKTFGIEKNQMHLVLEDMVKTLSNKYIDLDDILKALEDHQKSPFKDSERMNGWNQFWTGDDASRDLLGAMKKLEKEIKGIPDNSSPEKIKERDKKIDRLSVLYTIYRDSYRIMNIITQKDVYIDRTAESFISQHRSQISDASTYEFSENDTLKDQEINGLEIAINSEAKNELQKLYKKKTKKENNYKIPLLGGPF